MTTNKYIIALLVAILVVLLFLTLNQFDLLGLTRNESTDPSFEMIDPENPTTNLDNIVKLKRTYERNKLERCFLESLKGQVKFTLENLGKNLDEKGINNEPKLFEFLKLYQVKILYDRTWLTFNTQCSSSPNYTDPYSKIFIAQSIFQNSLINYSRAFKSILTRYNLSFNKYNDENLYDEDNYIGLRPNPRDGFNEYKQQNEFTLDGEKLSKTTIPEITNVVVENARKRFNDMDGEIKIKVKGLDSLISLQQNKYTEYVTKYSASRLDINDKAIKYGILAFCITALSMYLAGLAFRYKHSKLNSGVEIKKGDSIEDTKIAVWYSVYMITVLLLIITIFILGLARLLTENSLAALLGGIAGYVLNNRFSETNGQQKNLPTNQTPINN